jgi:hypothetical protein
MIFAICYLSGYLEICKSLDIYYRFYKYVEKDLLKMEKLRKNKGENKGGQNWSSPNTNASGTDEEHNVKRCIS